MEKAIENAEVANPKERHEASQKAMKAMVALTAILSLATVCGTIWFAVLIRQILF